jgi:hypothetical protein
METQFDFVPYAKPAPPHAGKDEVFIFTLLDKLPQANAPSIMFLGESRVDVKLLIWPTFVAK